MVAYSFKSRFAEPILAGTKRQTIRADRKRHARPGEEIQLYTGMRTRQCKLIARAICNNISRIHIMFPMPHEKAYVGGILVNDHNNPGGNPDEPSVDYWKPRELDAFAQRDGFKNWPDMTQFWRERGEDYLDWFGVLISWTPTPAKQ